MTTPLRPDQLARPVAGYHTTAATLADVMDHDTTLLVFLRHHG
jgi:hypothetical protein